MNPSMKIFASPAFVTVALDGYRDFTLASGCFDYLHRGHVELLKAAKRNTPTGYLYVAVNSDNSIRRLKGKRRPVCPLEDRMFMLAHLDIVDVVFPFFEDDVTDVLRMMRPAFWVKGGDWTLKTMNQKEVRMARKVGTKIVIIPRIGDWSTTGLLKKV